MITFIKETLRKASPVRRAEFAVWGVYVLACWLISFVGTFLFVWDISGSVAYATIAPIFIEVLAGAATYLYVKGSTQVTTFLRFLVGPALFFSVAHLGAVATSLPVAGQYLSGAVLAVIFVYGQSYVDSFLRNAGDFEREALAEAFSERKRTLENRLYEQQYKSALSDLEREAALESARAALAYYGELPAPDENAMLEQPKTIEVRQSEAPRLGFATQAEIEERRKRVEACREEGLTQAQTAEKLGLSIKQVRKVWQ